MYSFIKRARDLIIEENKKDTNTYLRNIVEEYLKLFDFPENVISTTGNFIEGKINYLNKNKILSRSDISLLHKMRMAGNAGSHNDKIKMLELHDAQSLLDKFESNLPNLLKECKTYNQAIAQEKLLEEERRKEEEQRRIERQRIIQEVKQRKIEKNEERLREERVRNYLNNQQNNNDATDEKARSFTRMEEAEEKTVEFEQDSKSNYVSKRKKKHFVPVIIFIVLCLFAGYSITKHLNEKYQKKLEIREKEKQEEIKHQFYEGEIATVPMLNTDNAVESVDYSDNYYKKERTFLNVGDVGFEKYLYTRTEYGEFKIYHPVIYYSFYDVISGEDAKEFIREKLNILIDKKITVDVSLNYVVVKTCAQSDDLKKLTSEDIALGGYGSVDISSLIGNDDGVWKDANTEYYSECNTYKLDPGSYCVGKSNIYYTVIATEKGYSNYVLKFKLGGIYEANAYDSSGYYLDLSNYIHD